MKKVIKKIAVILSATTLGICQAVYADKEPMVDTPRPQPIWHEDIIQLTKNAISQPISEQIPRVCLHEQVVIIAKQYLGTPYIWGGETPDGFDCSGFVQYVYKQLGVSISRTTYTQVNEGSPVNIMGLKQGDLVFFKKNDDIHHVGIYIGNNQFIHAPQTGDVIKISNLLDRSDYYTARRIIND